MKILYHNPTYRAINAEGHTLELRGEEKYIIHRRVKLAKNKHVSMKDTWRIIKPIPYEKKQMNYFKILELLSVD